MYLKNFGVAIKGLKNVNVIFAMFWGRFTSVAPYRHLDSVTSCKHMTAFPLNFGSCICHNVN